MPSPDWQTLLQLGVAFRELAPWKWMVDAVVFGVRPAGAKQIGWCVVLGAAGEVEGLCVYLGDSGFDTYRQIQDDGGCAMEDFWGQDALTLLFGDRDEVSPKQRAIFKEHGFKFRGRGAWPAFSEHRVGYAPRDLPAERVPFLTQCMKGVIVVASTLRRDPDYLDRNELLVLTGEQIEWVPEPAPLPDPAVPQPDQVQLGRLRTRFKAGRYAVEIGAFPLHMATVDGPDGPFAPAVAMAVEPKSGAVLGHEMGEPRERDALVQRVLMTTIEQAGVIPKLVAVASANTARALAPVTESLDIGLELVPRLPMLDQAREGMMGFFGGGS